MTLWITVDHEQPERTLGYISSVYFTCNLREMISSAISHLSGADRIVRKSSQTTGQKKPGK